VMVAEAELARNAEDRTTKECKGGGTEDLT